MKKITSPQNARLKLAAALQNARQRKKQARFLVQGEREIRRLLDGRKLFREQLDEIFVPSGARDESGTDWLPEKFREEALYELPVELFKKLRYGDRTESIVASVRRPAVGIDEFEFVSDGFYLVLDSIEKPGNLGAVFRTADGAGCSGILISNPLTDPFHPNAIRASMGTVFSIPFALGNADEIADSLRRIRIPVYAAVLGGESVFDGTDFRQGAAVVLGNEAQGVGTSWMSETRISLPMTGIADSLNISVAAAVFAYENLRQRTATWSAG